MSNIKKVILASSVPLALASSPVGRWGHNAIYVPSQQAMYVIGGQVVSSGSKITNDVLVLPLNTTGASFSAGPNDALPPHAFAAATLTEGEGSIVVAGGVTSSCSADALVHTLDLSGSGTSWIPADPSSFVRRRGAAAAWEDNGSADGAVMVIGGVADTYSCSSATYTYPATDVLSLPAGPNALTSTKKLPTGLTGSDLAVSEFAFTRGTDGTLYMVGGQDATGSAVPLNTIGKWSASGGWTSQVTSGSIPVGRVGASLVAHPTLDLLILHGGSVNNAATSTLAMLNTTSWTWTTPSNLQPPASSAAAYHSSIITSEGVMITAFGLGATGSPSSNVFYLDMRDPTQSAWTWKSTWNNNMLKAYEPSTDGSTNTGTHIAAADSSNDADKKKVTSIVVPVVIAALIFLPLAIWFIRRKVRMNKKRRMARHFSFSSQEDEGDFRSALNAFHSPSRRTKTQYGFGRDANEKDGNVLTDLAGAFKRLSRRQRRPSTESNSTTGEREMTQVDAPRVSRLDERTMRWEEIDFGLGRLDERAAGRHGQADSRRASMGPASTSVNDPFADPAPLIQLDSASDDSSHVGTPTHDGQQVLIPELTVQPPTVPPTPASTVQPLGSPFQPSPADGLDWNMLAQEMQVRPAFRSISATSTLRSHAHPLPTPPVARSTTPHRESAYDAYTPVPGPLRLPQVSDVQSSGVSQPSPPPRLPSLDFQRASISLLDPSRRSSHPNAPLPYASRAVSQPISRQLAGMSTRRGSASFQPSPNSSGSTTPTASSPILNQPRRASNPAPVPRSPISGPTTPKVSFEEPGSPGSPGTFGQLTPSANVKKERRESAMSKLRVMNMTEDDESSVETSHAA